MIKKELLYRIIYEKLQKEAVIGEMTKREIDFWLGVMFHIPKEYRHEVMKNLELMGYIKLKNGWGVYYIMPLKSPK
jgi:hypothetical protein